MRLPRVRIDDRALPPGRSNDTRGIPRPVYSADRSVRAVRGLNQNYEVERLADGDWEHVCYADADPNGIRGSVLDSETGIGYRNIKALLEAIE